MTWSEIAELIKNDPYCPVFASVFVKRSGDSDEIEDGLPSEEIIEKYVQSIMVMYLAHRPASVASPETLGLFEACYPQLKQVKLPKGSRELQRHTRESSQPDYSRRLAKPDAGLPRLYCPK